MPTFHTEKRCRRHKWKHGNKCYFCHRRRQIGDLAQDKMSREEYLLKEILDSGGRFFKVRHRIPRPIKIKKPSHGITYSWKDGRFISPFWKPY